MSSQRAVVAEVLVDVGLGIEPFAHRRVLAGQRAQLRHPSAGWAGSARRTRSPRPAAAPRRYANDSNSRVRPPAARPIRWSTRRRNWCTLRSLVSMTRSAIASSGRSSRRSSAIASARPSAVAGQRMAAAGFRIALDQHVVAASRGTPGGTRMPSAASSDSTCGRRLRFSPRLRTSTPTASLSMQACAVLRDRLHEAPASARPAGCRRSRSPGPPACAARPSCREPDRPLTHDQLVASVGRRVRRRALSVMRSPWRQSAQLVRLAVDEGLRRIDALALQHVAAHGGFGQHRDVAARARPEW